MTKAQLVQSQEEGVWGKTKVQLLSQEPKAPWGEPKQGIVHPPTSATPVQSGWRKIGTTSATPVQSGWGAKEGRSTPSLFGKAEDTIASKLGMRGPTVSAMKASFANNNPLRKGSLLADETPVMGKMTSSATPSAPIPITKQKMSKKQRQQAIKMGFNVEDLNGEEEAEHEGYKSSDLLSTPRPSKAPFFEQWDEGPSTPRPFQTRGLSQVPELSGRPEPVHHPSGLRNEIPVVTQTSESSGEFWMPGAAKGNWTEPEQAAADMWAPTGVAKAANSSGKQFWNSMLKEKTVPTPQAWIRTPGRKSAFEASQESASMLRKGKAVKGKAKPVMVEEVPDEEDESFDNLPVDSRYILEPKQPKPQAPPTAFDNIILYQPDNGEEEDEEDDEEEYDDMGWSSNVPTLSTARTSSPEAIDIDGVNPHWLEQASRNLQMSNAKMEKLFGGTDSGTVKAKLALPQARWGTSLGQAHDSSSSSSSASSPFFTDSEQYKSPFEMLGNKRVVPTKAPEPPKIPTSPKAAPKVSPAPPAPAPAPAPAPPAPAQASTPIEKAKAPVKPEP
ncbi:hypothetical protein BDQ17DRAFT_1379532 [Cyathus striatus]|nr:hypothetical protein BDQ17DRAFT_1379532 [Cyathus striatus]